MQESWQQQTGHDIQARPMAEPEPPDRQPTADLGRLVRQAATAGVLVVQPRMGMPDPVAMAVGLRAVDTAPATTVGTITLDSYTRVGAHDLARAALRSGADLNGYPIVAHGPEVTSWVVAASTDGPVQVRHGCADPIAIFRTMAAAGLSASEGGPVSYCLPYGRVPLAESVARWRDASAELAARCAAAGRRAHLETFGGCMIGQLCPPALLVAVSLLEALFFVQQGIRSVSLSFTQQTSAVQDAAALAALRQLAGELLPAGVDWHVVLYTYMGVFPSTGAGARLLLDHSAELAVRGGAERLVVKTTAEFHRLPTIAENVAALVAAADTARRARHGSGLPWARDIDREPVLAEVRAIVAAVLSLHDDVGAALYRAFRAGLLDVPYCLHQDNAGVARSAIDAQGRLYWADPGRIPLAGGTARTTVGSAVDTAGTSNRPGTVVRAATLLAMLRHTATEYDRAALAAASADGRAGTGGGEPEPRPYRIAIVGTGPRGLSVLERLAARLARRPTAVPVELYAVDAVQVGPGRIWRTSQPRWLIMNTAAGEVTMFSGPSDDGPTRAGAGPSLAQWWQAFDPTAHPHAYAPRALYGHYLRYVLNRIDGSLPPWARLHRLYATMTDLRPRPADGAGYRLTLDDGREVLVDRVVLCTGHSLPALAADQRALARFARHRPDLTYLRGDSAADLPLARIRPGARVGVLGLGLSFFDVMVALSEGRGGSFSEDPSGALRYRPSGREPYLLAGSRSGIPLLARGRNQKTGEYRYQPRLFTRERMRAARARGQLDFRTDVLPWLLAEVDLVYHSATVRARFGTDVERRFLAEAVAAGAAGTGDPRRCVAGVAARHGVGDVPEVDLHQWARGFAGRHFTSPAQFHEELVALLCKDIELADLGNVDGAVKACLDTIRDIRPVLRTAVDYRGLTPDSHRHDFLDWFVPISSNLSTGPPALRHRQVLALIDAGILRVVGPRLRLSADPHGGTFVAESPQVAGSRTGLDAIVDTRVPGPDLRRESGLLARLRDRGLLRGHVNAGPPGTGGSPAGGFDTGGVDVTPAPYHPIRADGRPEPGMYVLGIPTEHTRWFTQVGSGRPGGWGEFMTDADVIARDALRGAPADELAGIAAPDLVAPTPLAAPGVGP